MEIKQAFLTKNPCYKAGISMKVKGLMLHSVGCPQPEAEAFLSSWNKEDYTRACVHGFIDGNDGVIYQTLPWEMRGIHAGGSANDGYIGVEMCEPDCITYTSGSSFTCENVAKACEVAKRTYAAAVELFAMLCKQYGLDPLKDGVILSHKEGHARGVASNHGDPEHVWRQLKLSYSMDGFRKDVKAAMGAGVTAGLQATEFRNLTEAEVIAKVGPFFTADQKQSGILASVSLAQFILESGYGKSELAQNANNCFGMKKSLSGNTWGGSVWDGVSVYTKKTSEQNQDGSYVTVTADFRKYPGVAQSIADHSAYLLGAKNGTALRYAGLKGCTDYRKAVQMIKDGGYATSLTYVEKLCSIIEKWKLTQYDVKVAEPPKAAPSKDTVNTFPKVPFLVKVLISDLNYRSEPSMSGKVRGQTGKATFTIVEVKDGWGRLKSGAGWIWLKNPEYCTVGNTVQEQKTTAAKPAQKSLDVIAREVIDGKWGNGAKRKQKLADAGYDYDVVQRKVNEMLK